MTNIASVSNRFFVASALAAIALASAAVGCAAPTEDETLPVAGQSETSNENTGTQTSALPKDNGPGGGGGGGGGGTASCVTIYQDCYARCGATFGSSGFEAMMCEGMCDSSYARCTGSSSGGVAW